MAYVEALDNELSDALCGDRRRIRDWCWRNDVAVGGILAAIETHRCWRPTRIARVQPHGSERWHPIRLSGMSREAERFQQHLIRHTIQARPDRCSDIPESLNTVQVKFGDETHSACLPPGERDKMPYLVDAAVMAISPEIDIPHQGWIAIEVIIEESCYSVAFALEGTHGPGRFRFADGSESSAPSYIAHSGVIDDPPVDVGIGLLQPVTAREVAGVEAILQHLWVAIDGGLLSAAQCHQVQAMAELIQEERRTTEPGTSPRWKLIGPVRTVLRYLAREAPRDALAWWKLVELLDKLDWRGLIAELGY